MSRRDDRDLMDSIDQMLNTTRDNHLRRQSRQREQANQRRSDHEFHREHPRHRHHARESGRRDVYQPDGRRDGQRHPTEGGPPNSPHYPTPQRMQRERPRGQNSERHYDDVRRMYDRQHPGDPYPDPNAHRFHQDHGNHGAPAPQYEHRPRGRQQGYDPHHQPQQRRPQYEQRPQQRRQPQYRDDPRQQHYGRPDDVHEMHAREQQRIQRHRQIARSQMANGYAEHLPLPGLHADSVTHRARLGEDYMEAEPLGEAQMLREDAPPPPQQHHPHQHPQGYHTDQRQIGPHYEPHTQRQDLRAYVDADVDTRTAYERTQNQPLERVLEEIGGSIRATWQADPNATIRGRNLRGAVMPKHQKNVIPASELPQKSLQVPKPARVRPQIDD